MCAGVYYLVQPAIVSQPGLTALASPKLPSQASPRHLGLPRTQAGGGGEASDPGDKEADGPATGGACDDCVRVAVVKDTYIHYYYVSRDLRTYYLGNDTS